jgi:hypothetical protein
MCLERVIEVVANEQVEQSVSIEVHETGGVRSTTPGSPVPDALVTSEKVPLPFVVEHLASPESGEIEIHPAVVVDVARGDAHTVSARREPRSRLSVGE